MAYLALIMAFVFIGSHNYYVNKITQRSVLFTLFWRELLSSGILFILWLLFKDSIEAEGANILSQKGNIIAVVCGVFAFLMLYPYYRAMQLEKKGPISTIVYSYVGALAIISIFLGLFGFDGYGELPWKSYIGISFFVAGIIILTFKSGSGSQGIPMAIFAMVSYSLLYLFYKQIPPLVGVIYAAFLGRLGIWVVSIIPYLVKRDIGWFKFKEEKLTFPNKKEWALLIPLALLMAIGMFGISYSINEVPVEHVAIGIGMSPIVTIFLARIHERERLTKKEWKGVLVVFTSILLILLWK